EPRLEAQPIKESEMALFSECMPGCARKVLDTADIVRDGDCFANSWKRPADRSIFSRVYRFLSKRSSLRKPNKTTGEDENTKHRGTFCGLREAAMACEACGSANDQEFSAEIDIHFP